MNAKLVTIILSLAWSVFALNDQTFTDTNGKSWSLFAELEKGRAFLIQHEDAW